MSCHRSWFSDGTGPQGIGWVDTWACAHAVVNKKARAVNGNKAINNGSGNFNAFIVLVFVGAKVSFFFQK